MSLVERALKKLQESRDSSVQTARRTASAPAAAYSEPTRVVVSSQPLEHARDERTPRRVITVDKAALRAVGLLPPEHQERRLAEQYRQIKRPLISAALRSEGEPLRNGRLIMVTSALPGEGKTFTSINLAMSLSFERDLRTLLIDADVAKPHISRFFGVEHEMGLLDALCDPSLDIESMILPTDLPGLSILPAGRRSESATELLASHRMEALVAELERNDPMRMAVIDSPPLLLTNESRVLAQWVGQIVVVVCAGKTLQQELLEALSHLEQGKAIGLVLNQTVSAGSGYYYNYGEGEARNVDSATEAASIKNS